MSNFLVNEVSVLTTEVTFDLTTPKIIIPSGARTIDILNTSPALGMKIYITGNQTQANLTLGQVIVSQNVTYSFVDIGKSYPQIVVEGDFGAIANIVACY